MEKGGGELAELVFLALVREWNGSGGEMATYLGRIYVSCAGDGCLNDFGEVVRNADSNRGVAGYRLFGCAGCWTLSNCAKNEAADQDCDLHE